MVLLLACLLAGCGGTSSSAPGVSRGAVTAVIVAQGFSPGNVSDHPPLFCSSGQSNMGDSESPRSDRGLLAALQAVTSAQGWFYGGKTIAYWRADRVGWKETAPFLVPACTAFVWFQGESDEEGSNEEPPTPGEVYRLELADLLARVRARTAPSLPVFVVQIAPQFARIRRAQTEACSADSHCTYVSTDDLSFSDGTHLDAEGLRVLAQRILALSR